MSRSVPLTTFGTLSGDVVAELRDIVQSHTDLKTVLQYWHGGEPPRSVTEIVTQDEYTHDIVFTYDDDIYLVYDAT